MDNTTAPRLSDSHVNLMNLIMEQKSRIEHEDDRQSNRACDELSSAVHSTATNRHDYSLLNANDSNVNDDRQCSFNGNSGNSAELFRNVNCDDLSDDLINKQTSGEQHINETHPIDNQFNYESIAKHTTLSTTNLIDQIDELAVSKTTLTSHLDRLNASDYDLLNRLKQINYSSHQSNTRVHSTSYNTFSNNQTGVAQFVDNQSTGDNVSIWNKFLNKFNKKSEYERINEIDPVRTLNEKNQQNHLNQTPEFVYQHLARTSSYSPNSFENSPVTNFFQSVITTQRNMMASGDLSPDQFDNSSCKPPLSRADSCLSSTGIQLKQNLGLLNGVCIIVGVIVGSGIFISPKGVVESSHSVGLSLSIWVCCGILSLIGALCYAELGCAIPKSGGDYAYIREAFGDLPAFLFLWVATLIIMPTGNAIAALTFANYVLVPYYRYIGCGDPPEQAVQLIATILVCFLTFVNCYNVRLTAKLMDACTFAKVFALAIIIGVGFWQITKGSTQNFENAFQGSSTSPQQIALSFYAGLFSYAGWNYLNFVTEELKNPFKTLPKAIYISLPLVTVIYVLANVAYFTVLTPNEIIDSNAVAITFGDRILGIFSWTMPVFVVLSTFGGLNGSIFASSRLFFVGARNGHLPRILGQINVHYVTPVPSLLFMCLTTLVYLSTANVYLLINYTAFNESLFITFSVAALLWLRYKQPDLERPIKVNIILPIFFFIVCTFLVLLPVFEKPIETGTSALITLTGIPVYLVTIAWKNKPAFYNRLNDSITRCLQVLLITVEEKRS